MNSSSATLATSNVLSADVLLSLTCKVDLSQAELPILLICTLVVNVLAFFVLRRMGREYRSIDHLLVSILNMNDLLTSGVCFLSSIAGWSTCGRVLRNKWTCCILGWLISTMVVWSAFILVVMASCRYLSLVKPFYYRINVTRSRVMGMSLASLLFTLILFLFPMTGWGQPYRFYGGNNVCSVNFAPGGSTVAHRAFVGFIGVIGMLTVLHVLVCNIFIIRTLRQRATIQALNSATVANAITSYPSNGKPPTQHGTRHLKTIRFERVSLVVSIVYVFCYSPFTIRLIVDTGKDRADQNTLTHSLTLAILFMSPLLNPIIYGVFNKQFRSTLLALLRCRKQQLQPSSGARDHMSATVTATAR